MTTIIIATDSAKTPKVLLKTAFRWMSEIGGNDRFLVEIDQTTIVEFTRHRTTYSPKLHKCLIKLFEGTATIRVENDSPPQQLSLMDMVANNNHYQE